MPYKLISITRLVTGFLNYMSQSARDTVIDILVNFVPTSLCDFGVTSQLSQVQCTKIKIAIRATM